MDPPEALLRIKASGMPRTRLGSNDGFNSVRLRCLGVRHLTLMRKRISQTLFTLISFIAVGRASAAAILSRRRATLGVTKNFRFPSLGGPFNL